MQKRSSAMKDKDDVNMVARQDAATDIKEIDSLLKARDANKVVKRSLQLVDKYFPQEERERNE